ncbi:hypothetical protein WICPIJ_008528 [Wickerhamomyces pijperi]|uniref:Uncharacterized protein n=1 Tax=Wickerhamomyces pijperi TaxID=599730 RepID=A0A9P8PYV1_WICPI|nr:hypothetical protein WICPIJ_008528 [Wickerhamomyces pijperi]
MFQLCSQGVVWKHHTDKGNVESTDSRGDGISSPRLNQGSNRSRGEHTVGNGTWQVGVLGEDSGDVDWVEITRDNGVRLVCTWSTRLNGGNWNGVLKLDRFFNGGPVSGQVVNDWVTVGLASLVVNRTNLDNFLGWQFNQHLTGRLDRVVDGLALVCVLCVDLEDQSLTQQVEVTFLFEPFLGIQDSQVLGRLDLSNLQDWLTVSGDDTDNFDNLTRVLVDHGSDLSVRGDNIALLQWSSTWKHLVGVGQVHQSDQITIDGLREDGLDDGLPTNDNGEIHRSQLLSTGSTDKVFALVTNGVGEFSNVLASDGQRVTGDWLVDVNVQVEVFGEPQLPVELLDSLVSVVGDFQDWSEPIGWVELVQQVQGNSLFGDGSVFNQGHLDGGGIDSLHSDHWQHLTLDWLRDKNLSGWVWNKVGTLDDSAGGDEGVSPGSDRTSQQLVPLVFVGGFRSLVNQLVARFNEIVLDSNWFFTTKVFDAWDGGLVTVVLVLDQLGNVALVDSVQDGLDWFIDNVGELSSNWTVQDTCSLDILTNDGFQVFRLP